MSVKALARDRGYGMRLAVEHDWDVTMEEARKIQERLMRRVRIEDGFERVKLVGGADVSFRGMEGCAACVIMRFPELEIVEEVIARGKVSFPYVPGLLSFREGPVLLRALLELASEPDVVIFDGQGTAHPLGLGLASHMGVLLGKPTIGCAKTRLVGRYREPAATRGSVSPLMHKGRRVGSVVRTRTNVNPVFVSPGNLVSHASSVELVLGCARRYRIPEPTRAADSRCGRETLEGARDGSGREV